MAIIWGVQNGNSTGKFHFSVGQHWGCWSNSAPQASSVFMDYPKWGTQSQGTPKCPLPSVSPHPWHHRDALDRSCTSPWLTWGRNPRAWITFPAIPAASGATGTMEHYCQVFHTWFDFSVCSHQEETPWVSHPGAPSVTGIPPAVPSRGRCCSPHTGQSSGKCSPQVRGCFYLSSWEFFPDLLLFLASRGDERIFLDGGPESLP